MKKPDDGHEHLVEHKLLIGETDFCWPTIALTKHLMNGQLYQESISGGLCLNHRKTLKGSVIAGFPDDNKIHIRQIPESHNFRSSESKLVVRGEVKKELSFDYRSLPGLPFENFHSYSEASVPVKEWTGISLRHLLQEAGLKSGVTEIVFESTAERGYKPEDSIQLAKSLTIDVALSGSVFLIYPQDHFQTANTQFTTFRLLDKDGQLLSNGSFSHVTAISIANPGGWTDLHYADENRKNAFNISYRISGVKIKTNIEKPLIQKTDLIDTQPISDGSRNPKQRSFEISTDEGKTWYQGILGDQPSPDKRHW